MILQSKGLLSAVDIYTGRVLWETELPEIYTFGGGGGGLGIHSKKHKEPWKYPEALEFPIKPTERCRASGFNMVSLPNGIYVCAGRQLLRFNPESGEQISAWDTPDPALRWGGIRAVGELLITTAFHPDDLEATQIGHDGNGGDWSGDRQPMRKLIALNRESGELVWERNAKWGFVNRSGICAGGGKVFCVDLVTEKVFNKLAEAGREFPDSPPTLHALDLKTGAEVWSFPLDVYVQNIVYSEEHDLLLAPCRNLKEWREGKWVDLSIDVRRGTRNKNAAGRMRAFKGADGEVIWDQSEAAYHSPHIVLGDLIIDRWGHGYDLLTGKRDERVSPLTGQPETWSFRKSGCNHLVASQNLVTFRCAYYDLANQTGVKTLRGMDAGCSPTLLPAGGIVNIPNFGTHHKRNRMTAMALVHRPENQLWTAYSTSREKFSEPTEPDWIEHAGYNFGAPGATVDENGVLWLPVSRFDRSGVSFQPKEVSWFSQGSDLKESGIVGAEEISIPLTRHAKPPKNAKQTYRVKLHFAELDQENPVIEVLLEGKPAPLLQSVAVAGDVALEVSPLETDGVLNISLKAKSSSTVLSAVEVIRLK